MQRVTVRAPSGVRVMPSGRGGSVLEGGTAFVVHLGQAQPAEQRFGVVLETVAPGQNGAQARAMARWQSHGLAPRMEEVGSVFGVAGRSIDTRQFALVAENHADESSAWTRANELKERLGALGQLMPQVQTRAHGEVVVRSLEHDVALRLEGVAWFASQKGEPLELQWDDAPAKRYRGDAYVVIDRHGKLAVVNLVSEVDLLAGLVPAEMFPSAPQAALRAQAIAARGQLIGKIGSRHLDDPFLLCAHEHCQVYAGLEREHPAATRAVVDTQGRVAMRPTGGIVDTVYSANSGGFSENNDAVWPSLPDPQLRARPDPLLESRFASGINEGNIDAWLRHAHASYSRPQDGGASYRWTRVLTQDDMPADVVRSIGRVQAMEVLSRGASGRATALRLVGTHGEHDIVGELRMRRALGGLRSSLFVVSPQPGGHFLLHGGGYGHGVGMCQHGAIGMARAGHDTRNILAHYYQGAKVEKLW